MTLEGHICCWYMYVYNMGNKSWSLVLLTCMSSNGGPHVDYIISSHDPKSHVAPNFSYLDPRNAMVPLIMLLATHNVDASTIGIT